MESVVELLKPPFDSLFASLSDSPPPPKAQEALVDKFEPELWRGLLDFVTVYARDDVRFTFKDGTEIKV